MSLFFCKEHRKLAKTQKIEPIVFKILFQYEKNDFLMQKIKADAEALTLIDAQNQVDKRYCYIISST